MQRNSDEPLDNKKCFLWERSEKISAVDDGAIFGIEF